MIYGDGEQTRDFIYVDDVVSANLHVLAENLTGIYHVGTGMETSINTLWDLLAPPDAQKPIHAPAVGEIVRSSLDSTKLQETGWTIQRQIADLKRVNSTES